MLLAPIVEIFCDMDDFYKTYCETFSCWILPFPERKRRRESQMAASEIMTILVLFHLSHYRTFKDFYIQCVEKELKEYFPTIVSYQRFVEIEHSVLSPLTAYLLSKTGKRTNFYYLDSTALAVCHNKRIYNHKVFKGIAKRGKTSMGGFFGFKLHLVINHQGELINFCLTKGNVDDRKMLSQLTKNLRGLGAGDKGYIDKTLGEKLEERGLQFITKLRKNMKKKMLTAFEKFFLSQRSIVETVIEQLKYICQIDHSQHRNPINFVMNIIGGLTAYCLKPRKPSIKIGKFPLQRAVLIPS